MNGMQMRGTLAVGDMDSQSRGTFVSRTYGHLFGAVSAFTLIEVALFKSGLAEKLARGMLGVSWLMVLGGVVVISLVASKDAHSAECKEALYGTRYAFVGSAALIFVTM